MSSTYAKVIADSVSPEGVRLTTMEVRLHRFVLAEFNTHRVFSRNSASSRAIPVAKQLKRIAEEPAIPLSWPAEKSGMQGGEEIQGWDRGLVAQSWDNHRRASIKLAERMVNIGLHKSVVNRILEPHMWHTVVVTSTAWDNFFEQRVSPLAQPEIREAAQQMLTAYMNSEPNRVDEGHWHLPYVDDATADDAFDRYPKDEFLYWDMLRKISAARCARVSYLTQDGVRDVEKDIELYERLTQASPPHWSPLEHVATPWAQNRQNHVLFFGEEYNKPMTQVFTNHLPAVGNLLGWRSLRTTVEAQRRQVTYQ